MQEGNGIFLFFAFSIQKYLEFRILLSFLLQNLELNPQQYLVRIFSEFNRKIGNWTVYIYTTVGGREEIIGNHNGVYVYFNNLHISFLKTDDDI